MINQSLAFTELCVFDNCWECMYNNLSFYINLTGEWQWQDFLRKFLKNRLFWKQLSLEAHSVLMFIQHFHVFSLPHFLVLPTGYFAYNIVVNCKSVQKYSLPLPKGELYFLFPIMAGLAILLDLANRRWEVMHVTSSSNSQFGLCPALFSSALVFQLEASRSAWVPRKWPGTEPRLAHNGRRAWTCENRAVSHGDLEAFHHSVTSLVMPDTLINCSSLLIPTIFKALSRNHILAHLHHAEVAAHFSTLQMRRHDP